MAVNKTATNNTTYVKRKKDNREQWELVRLTYVSSGGGGKWNSRAMDGEIRCLAVQWIDTTMLE